MNQAYDAYLQLLKDVEEQERKQEDLSVDAKTLKELRKIGLENMTKHPVKVNSLDGGEM